ncbi:MAG TPA: hypothetical protein VNX60_07905 [Candidatus Acidoferrum sp.]|nr:hypothetical protein [Candidatus Acidoferrum sp.]
MRNIVPATLLSGALLCAASFAQSAPSAQNPSAPPAQPEAQPASPSPAPTEPQAAIPRIAPGSVIPVQLTKTIDAKKAKPGDEVVAKVTVDLKTTSGALVVPKDTKVVGHVTEAQARSKEQKESQIGIAFDHAVLRDGDLSLPMSIQAVIAPPTSANNASSPDQSAPAGGGSVASSPMGAGHSGASGSAGQTQPSSPVPNAVGTEGRNNTPQGASAQPEINGNTQGVVGISNLKLEPPQTTAQGSVLSSDKNNVKLESGTFMLLKVNQ